MDKTRFDLVIVGGASAGLTAALYSSRLGLKTLVITKDVGGQALLTNDIQNYPGFDQISGFELMTKFQDQAAKYGVEFAYDEAKQIEGNNEAGFSISTPFETYTSVGLILAFGKTPRDLGVPGEEEFKGRGVSYCAVCDGPLYKGSKVAVIGNGDQALEAANYLSGIAEHVYIIQSSSMPRGDAEIIETLNSSGKATFISGSRVKSIEGNFAVESLNIVDSAGKESALELPGIFIENGYITRTEFIKDLVELNELGEIVTDRYCRTSAEGIFAAGDVTDVPYKQAIISAGQGSIAALSSYNYIQKKRGKPAAKNDWKAIN